MVKIVILNDTRNSSTGRLFNDDGFSALIKADGRTILFDAGPSDNFIKNANTLNVNLDEVDTAVLSHGHFDHGDGFKYFDKRIKFISHPGCVQKRWWKDDHSHYSGIQLSKEDLENKYEVIFSNMPYNISENIFFLGEIPRTRKVNLKKWVLENGENDEVLDDSGIAINTPDGIIVVVGCSHSGICNIVEYAKKVTCNNKVRAVIGGFHLREVNSETQDAIYYMKENVKEVILAHCTADTVYEEFQKQIGDKIRVSITEVGKEYEF